MSFGWASWQSSKKFRVNLKNKEKFQIIIRERSRPSEMNHNVVKGTTNVSLKESFIFY